MHFKAFRLNSFIVFSFEEKPAMARAGGAGKHNSLKRPKEEISVKYMHRPPLITPNYGNPKRSLLPKSKVSRVLLYDNATQDHMLDIKLAHINIEKERICRIINLHKKSFSARMQKKHLVMQNLASSNSLTTAKSTRTGSAQEAMTSSSPHTLVVENEAELNQQVEEHVNEVNEIENETNIGINDIKLPNIENDKRHVIFKVKDKEGKTEVYHTVDEHGVLSDIIPLHGFYSKMVDDPRFKSLQNILVPMQKPNT